MTNNHIAIVGGGIGGVATALALQRLGIPATVYERASEVREAGAGMMLWPNATRVLRELGILDSVRERSGASDHFLVRSMNGEVLMDIALGRFDVPALCTRRADLLQVLLSKLSPDCIRLGHEFTKLEHVDGGVRLRFQTASGEQVMEHHAAIGADGIRSRVRDALFGESQPVYRGYMVWRGIAKYSGAAVGRGENSESWGRGKRFGILDTGADHYTWYATANSVAGRHQELLEMFSGWHAPVCDLIRATEPQSILKNAALDRAPLARWSDRCVTLLGDAAHPCTPNLGQGCCMAIEDSMVLAKCVAGERAIAAAFSRYETLRHGRTSHVQERSRLMGRIGQWENRALVRGRDFVTRALPGALFEFNLRRMYSYET